MIADGIVALAEAGDPARYGGKACQLGRALTAGLPVPPGLAVSVAALRAVTAREPAMLRELEAALRGLAFPVAARSSAIGEDSGEASFAGQHVSVLNLVSVEGVVEGLAAVHASATTPAALAYRRKRDITAEIEIAAVVQQLVDPVAAGVLFTRNPMTGARETVIEAAWGLGEVVVAGTVTPDHVRATPDGAILEMRAGDKHVASRAIPGGGTHEIEADPARAEAFCIDAADVVRLCALARRCEAVFGPDLDLEWALAGEAVWLLQSRPITTRAA